MPNRHQINHHGLETFSIVLREEGACPELAICGRPGTRDATMDGDPRLHVDGQEPQALAKVAVSVLSHDDTSPAQKRGERAPAVARPGRDRTRPEPRRIPPDTRC